MKGGPGLIGAVLAAVLSCWSAAPAVCQDGVGGEPAAPPVAAAGEPEAAAGDTPRVPLGLDGLPVPAFWTLPEGGHASDWLEKPPIDPADLRDRLAAYEEALASHGILVDTEAREIIVRGATIHDARSLAYPVEYLVVTEQGRTHEALVLVRAQPSVLDACLRALELAPGGPTVFELKDPQPSDEDLEAGRASPWLLYAPYGPLLEIEMSWVDDEGLAHTESLESLLLDHRTGERLDDLGWIYTGSTYAKYRRGRSKARWYKADVEGDVVAIYLAGLEVCLFERNSLDGLEDGFYFPDPVRLPAPRTPVTLTFRITDTVVPQQPPTDGPLPEPLPPEEPEAADDEGEGAEAGESGR